MSANTNEYLASNFNFFEQKIGRFNVFLKLNRWEFSISNSEFLIFYSCSLLVSLYGTNDSRITLLWKNVLLYQIYCLHVKIFCGRYVQILIPNPTAVTFNIIVNFSLLFLLIFIEFNVELGIQIAILEPYKILIIRREWDLW